ncbi:hypothetical protein CEUSTIGMA_g2558.t1 [Chlamydomonas eustigma]|uniref:Uncharacterized protein n=1 Tax=Chlamydomonas eustigma TaxID=1157962 RepID=A0A250WWA0_9CHLO|nr:hypothetical protein CEUSTIGMA_g2558.t1 [Chlamydomonas eustigma]|eukprot:GAX75114.1 hypothetical protein CEUSTIGMA_g2558.t1 [Chlamydomonas eustigma]
MLLASVFIMMESLGAPSLNLALAYPEAGGGTFENIPGQLRSDGSEPAVRLGSLFSGKKKKEIEQCTRKCVPTCTRGGEGPGLGPISMRKEIIVFKSGFRSRAYCLSECAQVCSLSINSPGQDASSTSDVIPPR